MNKKGVLLAGILLLFALRLPAQEVVGRMEGRVLDPEGRPLAGVQVVATGPSWQGFCEVRTAERGYFRFFSLPSGLFNVKRSSSRPAAMRPSTGALWAGWSMP